MTTHQGLVQVTRFYGRPVLKISKPTPLVGHIAFGIIDRGTNVLQVRPSTLCPHNCIYCSVDAGPSSRTRRTEYIVDANYLAKWVTSTAEYKNIRIEVLLDGVGEPLSHPQIYTLIQQLRQSPHIWRIALETHGGFLSKGVIRRLANVGLDRINLSLDSLDPMKARMLAGVEWYDVRRIIRLVEYTVENTDIDVILTPVVVPGINEEDMYDLIELARSLHLGKKSGWPTGVLIQKYEVHRFGRKVKGAREWSWREFYTWLRRLEEQTRYPLRPSMEDLGIRRARKLPVPYGRGEKVALRIIGPGWHKGEWLGVFIPRLDRVASIFCPGKEQQCAAGRRVVGRVVRNKDNIYVVRV